MQKSINKIALAGSGNVASRLAKGLFLQGFQITGIWSRDHDHAKELAGCCNSKAVSKISALRDNADMILIAVPDTMIQEIAGLIGEFDGITVHTAGSVPMEVLKNNVGHYGVFYPLQTFSKDTTLALDKVPFLLEASSPEVMQVLRQVALKLSDKVYPAESQQRLLFHVAAVFAGNYSNLMYIIGNELLDNFNLPHDILHPLIMETARKAVAGDALKMQTGPARRNDNATIEKHIEALASFPEFAELYRILASHISRKF